MLEYRRLWICSSCGWDSRQSWYVCPRRKMNSRWMLPSSRSNSRFSPRRRQEQKVFFNFFAWNSKNGSCVHIHAYTCIIYVEACSSKAMLYCKLNCFTVPILIKIWYLYISFLPVWIYNGCNSWGRTTHILSHSCNLPHLTEINILLTSLSKCSSFYVVKFYLTHKFHFVFFLVKTDDWFLKHLSILWSLLDATNLKFSYQGHSWKLIIVTC